MAHTLDIQTHPESLYIQAHGEASFSTYLEIAEEVVLACQGHHTHKAVLNVQEMTGKIDIGEIYYLVKQLRDLLLGQIAWMATVHRKDHKDFKDFFELTAMNHGLPVKTFFEPHDALAWMRTH
jgi:hypothetical protein